jgi:hypothetical protein
VLEWFLFVGVSSEKALFHMKIKFILLKNLTAFRYVAKLWMT